jgi:autotransporter-associated beta strand protein
MNKCGTVFLVVVLLVQGSVLPAAAGTRYWDPALSGGANLGGNGSWNTVTANWWNASVDVGWVNANGDDAVFQNLTGTVSVDSTVTVHNLTFNTQHNLNLNAGLVLTNNSIVTVNGSLDIRWTTAGNLSGNSALVKEGTGTLRFNFGTPVYAGGTVVNAGTMTFDNSGSLPVNGDLTVAADAVVDIYTTADLTVGGLSGAGTIQCGTFQDRILTVGGNNANSVFNGTLKDNANGKKLILRKAGNGTLVLAGTNTFSGGVSIYGGRLSISSSNNLGSNTVVMRRGMLCITGTSITNLANMSMNWGSTIGCGLEIENPANVFTVTNCFYGSVSNNGSFVFNLATNENYYGVISGTGTVVKTGSGVLTLCAASAHSGPTVINNGTLKLFYNPAPTSAVVSGATTNTVWLDGTDIYGKGANPDRNIPVTVWTNKATGGSAAAHFTLQTAGSVTYFASERPAIHFDGAGMLATATDIQAPVSVFYVGGLSGGQNYRLVGSVSLNFLLGYWGNCMNCSYWNGVGNYNSSNTSDCVAHVWAGTHNGSSYNAYRFDSWVNEWKCDSGSGGAGPGRLALGGGCAGVNELSKGDVSEVLVYNSVLGDLDRTNVEVYLHNKWLGVPPGYGEGALSTNTSVYIYSGGWLDLGGTTQTVAMLYLDGQKMPASTFGAAGSGAKTICANHFTGSGILRVLHGTRGTVIMLR